MGGLKWILANENGLGFILGLLIEQYLHIWPKMVPFFFFLRKKKIVRVRAIV
jgi:hypothetical protein